MKILLTGGTGFLGRVLVRELTNRHSLRLLVRPGARREGFPAGVEFSGGDVTDPASLGAAMAGFEALRDDTGGDSTAFLRPLACLGEGEALASLVSAMMDVSDGLLLDASRMAEASGVTLALNSADVPIAVPESRRADALRWGEDYELLFTLPADVEPKVSAWRIGEVRARGDGPLLLDGKPPAGPLGYEH